MKGEDYKDSYILKFFRESILSLQSYTVPQKAPVKLNQNESPFDLPVALKEEIFQELKRYNWNRYPPLRDEELLQLLADYTGWPVEGILTGNGSNELIQILFYAVLSPHERLLVVNPGFAVYPRMAKFTESRLLKIRLKEDFSFDTASIIKALREEKKIKMVILACPNNPTGTVMSLEEIEEILKNTSSLVVIDEAYYEFYGRTAVDLLHRYKNLIVLRTLSKAFSAAGLRSGYLLAHPEVVKVLEKTRLPFSSNIFQLAASRIILRRRNLVKKTIETILKERKKLFVRLAQIDGIEPIPSHTNFILFKSTKLAAEKLFDELKEKGILVRYFPTQELKDFLRVTIGREEENATFIKTLNEILKRGGDRP